jgi:hypothetical protein
MYPTPLQRKGIDLPTPEKKNLIEMGPVLERLMTVWKEKKRGIEL